MLIANLSSSVLPSQKANSVQVMRMSDAFAKCGHSVVLFGKRPGKACERLNSDAIKEFYGTGNDFDIRLVNCRLRTRFWAGLEYGFKILLSVLKLQRVSFKKLQTFRGAFDLFYGRNLYTLLFCNYFNKPIIYESHASPSYGRKKLEEYLFKQPNFAGLVVINQALYDYYRKNFEVFANHPEKIIIESDCAEETFFDFADSVKKSDNTPVVGYAGSLYTGKGIEIIAKLAEERPSINFIIAGGTEEQISLMKQRWPFPNLKFRGFIKPSELAGFYNECDILLAPYQQQVYSEDNEKRDLSQWMSPLKVFEYMGTGKPMIVSDMPCFHGILRNKKTALLAGCDNITEWLKALDSLLEQPELRKFLSDNAYLVLKSRFTWKARAERIITSLYNSHLRASETEFKCDRPVILHVVGDLNVGGAERTMLNLLSLINKDGFEHRILTLFEEGSLADDFRNAGVSVETLGLARSVMAFLNPVNAVRLVNTIKSLKPQLIQTWMYHSNNLVNALHCFFKDIPVVNNIRHNDPWAGSWKTRFSAYCGGFLAWLSPSAVVTCSDIAKKNHIAIGYPEAKLRVIPNGFVVGNLSRADERQRCINELSVPVNNKLVIVAGRYCKEKDFPNFAAAAGLIARKMPDVSFMLCGKNLDVSNEELLGLLDKNNVRNNCILLGQRSDVKELMAAADLLISASASEAFPNVVAEAMSVGTPCIGTDVGETRAIIGDAGKVVPAKNPKALADAVLFMLSNAEAYSEFTARAKAHIAANYSLEATANMYTDLWAKCFNTKQV